MALHHRYNVCKTPLKLLNDIAAHITAEDYFKTLFKDLILKSYLYMGHTVRVIKKNAIKNVTAKMNIDPSVCVVVMEFKMKF